MDSNARDDFDKWTALRALVAKEWGDAANGGGARFTLCARAAANDSNDGEAMRKLREVCFAQREIHNLMSQVERAARGEERELVTATVDYSRRGGL